jgi:hypothetical protein
MGTYYGGLDDDYITDSQIDSNGLLYVLGISSSSNNISTINTNTPSHSNADSFLIKFDSVEIEFGVLILAVKK